MTENKDRHIAELELKLKELRTVLRDRLVESVQLGHDKRMAELKFVRSTALRTKILKLLPALINGLAGREILPLASEDTALITALAEHISEEEMRYVCAMLSERTPEIAALLAVRFERAQKKRREDEREDPHHAAEAQGDPQGPSKSKEAPAGQPDAKEAPCGHPEASWQLAMPWCRECGAVCIDGEWLLPRRAGRQATPRP